MRATFRPATEFRSPLVAHHDVEDVLLRSPCDVDADPQTVLGPEEEPAADAASDDSTLVLEDQHVAPGRSDADEARPRPSARRCSTVARVERTAVLSFWYRRAGSRAS